MNKLSFGELLAHYSEAWEHVHRWGRIIRSANFIEIVRMLHIVLMGHVLSEVVDIHYIDNEFHNRYGENGNVSDILMVALKEGLIEKKKGVYELTLNGRLFLFLISDILVEVATFYDTPPTQREIVHILRLLSMLRVYEGEGLIAENIGLLTTALGNIRRSAKFVSGDDSEELYDKLIEEYKFIKNLTQQTFDDEDFTRALQALASLIDTELVFVKEHLQEIKRLRRKSFLLLHISSSDLDDIRDLLLENVEKYFDFSLFSVSDNIIPVSYIRKYPTVKEEKHFFMEEVSNNQELDMEVLMPSADELFNILWLSFVNEGHLPSMANDKWWLDKLTVYRESYDRHKEDKGFIRAIKARKVMALSMFLVNAFADEKLRRDVVKKGKEYFENAYNEVLSCCML